MYHASINCLNKLGGVSSMLRRKETGTNGKYDMIDLIITSLIEHEKVLSELSYRFEEVVFLLEKVLHEKGGD